MRALVLGAILLAAALPALPASATPDPACSGTCTALSSFAGYVPPVLVIHNGSEVVWDSLDASHIQRETSRPLGSTGTCFAAVSDVSSPSTPVKFEIQGSVLNATTGATTSTCANAVPLAGEGFALAYHCTLHPQMRGVIVVVE